MRRSMPQRSRSGRGEAHHALEDAFVTARLWQKLLAKLEAMKIANLGNLLRVDRA